MINLEAKILMTLGFDLHFPGPVQSLERFLRILDFNQNQTVFDMAF